MGEGWVEEGGGLKYYAMLRLFSCFTQPPPPLGIPPLPRLLSPQIEFMPPLLPGPPVPPLHVMDHNHFIQFMHGAILAVTIPPAHPWGFVIFSSIDVLFPNPGHTERENSPLPGLLTSTKNNLLLIEKESFHMKSLYEMKTTCSKAI